MATADAVPLIPSASKAAVAKMFVFILISLVPRLKTLAAAYKARCGPAPVTLDFSTRWRGITDYDQVD
jgi:hypothetical protein